MEKRTKGTRSQGQGIKMTDLNTVTIVGRLTKDVTLEYTSSGMAICKGSIAVNRNQKKNGEWQTTASFFDFSILGKIGENLKMYLTKGKQVVLGGYLKQDRWTGQDGQNHSKVYIGVESIQLCGSKESEKSSNENFEDGDFSYGF